MRENSVVFFLFFMKKVVNGIYQERYWTTQHIISQENKTAKLAVKNHEFLPKKKKDSTLPKVTVSKTCQSTWFSQSDTKKCFCFSAGFRLKPFSACYVFNLFAGLDKVLQCIYFV